MARLVAQSEGRDIATPIVAPDHFLLATRDAGYRNLASALTESTA